MFPKAGKLFEVRRCAFGEVRQDGFWFGVRRPGLGQARRGRVVSAGKFNEFFGRRPFLTGGSTLEKNPTASPASPVAKSCHKVRPRSR